MFWAAPSRSSPRDLFEDLARLSGEMSVLNLVARDQTAIQSLPERLTDETRFDCARFYQVENRPQRAGKLKPWDVCTSSSGRLA
jgi:hypothetical protein